jgi:peptidoglycan-associated lipoprotein
MSVTIIPSTLPYPYSSYPGMPVAILVFFHGKSMKAAINIKFSGIGGEENTMHVRSVATIALIIMALSLALTGCAPKSPAPQTSETTATGQPPAGAAGGAQEQAPAPAGQAKGGEQAQAAGGFDKKVYFDYDSIDLSPESTQVLDSLAGFLKDNPVLKLQVAGNCDERGTTEYNLALGDRRAKAAKDYLVTKGIDGQKIATISYGEEKPVDPGHTEDAWAKNRRDEFLFSK